MIAPSTASKADLHYLSLEERLKHAWPFYHDPPLRAYNWKDLENVWKLHNPSIIYYYGYAESSEHTLNLIFETDQGDLEQRPITDLIDLWISNPPQIVFFNLLGDHILTGTTVSDLRASLVITQTSADPREARRSALQWFHELLERGEEADPVWILQQTGLPTAAAWTVYSQWKIHTTHEPTRDKLASLLLDRKSQCVLSHNAVRELVKGNSRRLCCILSYGEKGNLVKLFAEQLHEYLRRNAREVQVYRVPLHLPAKTSFDVEHIEIEVRKRFGLGVHKSLAKALDDRKPTGPGQRPPVLLLDWGVRGTTEENRINLTAVEAWLAFCCEQLAAQCPNDLYLISCLSLEISKESHVRLEREVKAMCAEARFRDPAFLIELLHPLNQIGAAELTDFLEDPDYSSCPSDLIEDISKLIFNKTRGFFQETVALVEQAELISWYDLYDNLLSESVRHPEISYPNKEEPLL